jgi:MoaA/NifB/PqqE/SkfB family radical SAM enzyme
MPSSWIVFHLTERCQLACKHCLRAPASPPAELPVAVVERVLDQAIALHRVQHVALTGGEPTLHPALPDVVDAIVVRGLTWHVVTNGGRLDALLALLEAAPARRAALTAVDLSLDGADEATHDANRGAGSWRNVMAAALALRAREAPFALQVTITRRNLEQLEHLGLLAAQLGAKRLSFATMQATGRADDQALRLTHEDLVAARDRVHRLAEHLRLPVTAAEGFPREQPFHVCEPWRSDMLHVDSRGRLTLCCQLSAVGGGDEDVIADLANVPLPEAHSRLLDRIHLLQRERLALAAGGRLEGWELSTCNWCARRHGKPHWTNEGSVGESARPRPGGGE